MALEKSKLHVSVSVYASGLNLSQKRGMPRNLNATYSCSNEFTNRWQVNQDLPRCHQHAKLIIYWSWFFLEGVMGVPTIPLSSCIADRSKALSLADRRNNLLIKQINLVEIVKFFGANEGDPLSTTIEAENTNSDFHNYLHASLIICVYATSVWIGTPDFQTSRQRFSSTKRLSWPVIARHVEPGHCHVLIFYTTRWLVLVYKHVSAHQHINFVLSDATRTQSTKME